MITDEVLRYFLAIYCICFFLVCAWRRYVVWKALGKFPVVLGSGDSIHALLGRAGKYLGTVWAVAVFVFAVTPQYYVYIGPIYTLELQPLRVLGILLLVVSLPWVAIAQAQMGKSFRIGVDVTDTPDFVGRGLFRLSRNPIYLGILAGCLGIFLCIPNALTAVLVGTGLLSLQVQTRIEEEYLRNLHGATFDNYCRKVRRWL